MPHSHPVLIADDDEDTIFFMERALRRSGIKNPVQIAHDGAEALSYLESQADAKPPRLALVDLKMPLKDGFDVLKAVRGHPKLGLMPVIIFSSSFAQSDISRAYKLGANSYVVKPGDPAAFQDFINKIHDYWLNVNASPKPEP